MLDVRGKIAVGRARRLQAIVATSMPVAGGGVMTVKPQDFFIADLNANGGTATAFPLAMAAAPYLYVIRGSQTA